MPPVAILAAILALGVGALWFGQDSMIYYPQRYGPEAERPIPRVERIDFRTSSGAQSAWWVAPTAGPGATSGTTWYVFGGNAMVALGWLPDLEPLRKAWPADGFLLVDYPGYGRSEGKPTRSSIVEAAKAARAALAERLGAAGAPSGPEAVLGISIGCAPALELAATLPVRRVVLLAPFTSMVDMARQVVGWPLCHLVRDRFDNRARLAEILATPDPPEIEIFHGIADEVIPVAMGRELASAGAGRLRFTELPGLGHNDLIGPVFERLADETGQSAPAPR